MSAPASTPQNIDQRIQQLDAEIEQLSRRLRRSSTVTLIVGLIIVLLLFSYLTFGYRLIMPRLDAKAVVDTAVGYLEQQLPEASSELKRLIDEQADDWGKALSEQLLAQIPDFRKSLAQFAEKQMEELVASTIQYSEDEIRKVLREHKDALNKAVEELAASDRLSDRTVQELEAMLEEQLKAELEEQSAIVLETVRMLNEKIKKLKEGKDLNKEEQLERRVLMLARRLQLNAADPSLKDKPIRGVTVRKPPATTTPAPGSPGTSPKETPSGTPAPKKGDRPATAPDKAKDASKKDGAPKASTPENPGPSDARAAAAPKEPPPPPLPEDRP